MKNNLIQLSEYCDSHYPNKQVGCRVIYGQNIIYCDKYLSFAENYQALVKVLVELGANRDDVATRATIEAYHEGYKIHSPVNQDALDISASKASG